jgi:hypothetical protein
MNCLGMSEVEGLCNEKHVEVSPKLHRQQPNENFGFQNQPRNTLREHRS